MANVNIFITSNESSADLSNRLKHATDNPKREANSIENYFAGLASGFRHAKVDVQVQGSNGAYASGTLTLASVVATNACTINGVSFACVASGATGNQFNRGADDTATAANLAATINASVSASVQNVVVASSSGAVVTVQAFVLGPIGNLCTLTGSANIAASGANLSGGTYSASIYSFGL